MNLQNLCENRTPMIVRCVPLEDRHGREVLAVIAKLTYTVAPNGVALLAEKPSPIRMSDEPHEDALFDAGWLSGQRGLVTQWGSIRFPSDVTDEKPGTDILLVGTAYPPLDRAITDMTVSLRLERGNATIYKAVRVHGARVHHHGMRGVAPGPAAPLRPTPLLYELAYGGYEEAPGVFNIERRNPAGLGFVSDPTRLVGQRAPVIEDARATATWRTPAGFGPIPASWAPRADHMGTYDAAWQHERAPVKPVDFNPRANCCAPPDLWSDAPLAGDEPVEILGATPEGVWRFQLPRYGPRFFATVRGLVSELPTHLDTYLIDADGGRVELVWRAVVPVPRPIELIDSVLVVGDTLLPEPLEEDLRRRQPASRPS
ncbi:MAG: DUF2169 domain-containing protein [Minicystis sp.]